MDLFTFLINILYFFNDTLVPFIIALAFLFFIFNATRYFIFQGASEDGREKAKRSAFWGIIAFVFILSLWGIVNMLVYGFGFSHFGQPLRPDYMEESGGLYGSGTEEYDCTDIAFGFGWCSRGTIIQRESSGSPRPLIDPNPSPQNVRIGF